MEQQAQSWDERWIYRLLPAYAFAVPVSIALAEPIGFIVIALWLYRTIRTRDDTVFRNPLFLPIFAFTLIALVSIPFSVRPLISLGKCHRLLLAMVVFAIGTATQRRESGVSVMVWLFALACSLRAIYHVGYIVVSMRRGMDVFDTGNMRDPQMYLVALCFLLAAVLVGKKPDRSPATWGGIIATAAGLLLNFKRGAWLAFVLAVGAMTSATRRWRAVLFAVALVAAIAFLPQTRNRIRMLNNEFSLKMGGRYALWTKVALPLMKEYPHGMGYAASRNEDFRRFERGIQDGLHHLHNNVLQVRLELGWVGLVAWIWWITATLVSAWRTHRRMTRAGDRDTWIAVGAFGALIGILANGVVEYNFGDSEILMLAYLVMGVIAVLRGKSIQRGGGVPA